MFSIFSKRNFRGQTEFDRFKTLMSDRAVFEATLQQSATGISGMPFHLANKVQESVNLCYSLTSMTSLSDMQLLEAVHAGKWSELKQLVMKYSDSIDAYKQRNSGDLRSIIDWANRNSIPQYAPFDSTAYRATGLPRTEDELVSLRYLHIPNANLTEIPKEFAVLPMVKAVCLSGNRIKSIPLQFFEMPSVYRLDLDDNDIEEIPDEISRMKQLQQLDLDENNLKRIPRSLLSIRSLKSLMVRRQKHGLSLLSPSSPLSEDGVRALGELSFRSDFKLRA